MQDAGCPTIRILGNSEAWKEPGDYLEEREGRRPEHDDPVLLTPLFA